MTLYTRVGALTLVVALATIPCEAATVTLNAIDSGFYFAAGTHQPAITNHLTGRFGTEHRSFLVFDLSSVSGSIQSATLRLFNPEVSRFLRGYVSPDPTETLAFFDVSTPASAITGNTAGVAGFDDLGSGTTYGSRTVSASDNGTIVEIGLNSAALADLNAAKDLFLIGGALTTLGPFGDQYVFGFSTASFVPNHTRELVLDVAAVPEPTLLVLLGLGAMGAGKLARSRRRSDS